LNIESNKTESITLCNIKNVPHNIWFALNRHLNSCGQHNSSANALHIYKLVVVMYHMFMFY